VTETAIGGWRSRVRPAVARLEPYVWEMSSEEVAARYGLPVEAVIRFDTNTSPFLPTNLSPTLAELATRMPLNEYPDTSYGPLAGAITAYTGFPPEQQVIGCGADEVLDMVAKTFVEAGTRCVVTQPSYGMYPVLVATYGGTVVPVPDRPDFGRDVEAIARAAARADVVWLCNPNNPTANLIPLEEIAWLVERTACPVVIDEAYFEFSGVTAAGLIAEHPQLIVVRTLSKAFSLAGLRVGYGLASREMAAMVNRVRPPNSVGTLSVALGAAALSDLASMRERVRLILAERPRFAEALRPHVAEVYPSATNFLVVRTHDARAAVEALLRAGIVARDVSGKPGLANCLRPTVRLPEENARFVEALARAR
jgi:histidinol-phosphate aminotransferase